MVLRAMVGLDSNNFGSMSMGGVSEGGNVSAAVSAAPHMERMRNRMKPRLHAKGISSLSDIPENRRNNFGTVGEMNRRLSDMKEEPGLTTDISTRLQVPQNSSTAQAIIPRRDSMASNASSFYYSMKSADVSRRSSQASQYSVVLSPPSAAAQANGLYGMRNNSTASHINYNASSFYDPISPGSSRRSSQMSTVTTGGQSLPPQPSSTLLTSHLQRLQNSTMTSRMGASQSGRYSIPNAATMSSGQMPNHFMSGMSDRRMSEPLYSITEKEPLSPNRRPRSVTPKPTKSTMNAAGFATTEYHPNQEVILDEVQEGEMVEDKLIIPEEFLDYLNQVDCANQNTTDASAMQKQNASPAANTIKKDQTNADNAPMDNNAVCQNPNMWRNPQSNLYSIASPSTQPHSPASAISQIMSPDPHQPRAANTVAPAPAPYAVKLPVQQNAVPTNAMGYNNNNSQQSYNYQGNESQQQQMQPFAAQSAYPNPFASNACGMTNPNAANQGMSYNTMNGFAGNAMRNGTFAQDSAAAAAAAAATRTGACSQTPGYFHRTDQSAMNCCQLFSALQISEDLSHNTKPEPVNQPFCVPDAPTNPQAPTAMSFDANSTQAQHLAEIQCGDISQSQMSPAVPMSSAIQNVQKRMLPPAQAPPPRPQPTESQALPPPPPPPPPAQPRLDAMQNQTTAAYPPHNATNIPRCECGNGSNEPNQQPCMYHSGMCHDTYQRTLEYVQSVQTQSWVENAEAVTSSTHPSSNMIINDMSTSLNSLLEENRYLQMIQ